MPRVSEEPALGFWLRYAEGQGALVEDHGDHAVVVLPDALQEESELPEDVTVTSHPDVAREDAAVLLIEGHPAVERAAVAVLAEGDTGSSYLPWPASRAPTRSTLEARARELVSIEHARIDAAGEPIAAYLPLLRVGAMVSYEASLTLRFQEQEEAWIDARTALEPSPRLLAALEGGPRLPQPDRRVRTLEADVPAAISVAHRRLELSARVREAALGAHARRALDAELTRADAYYDAALESIARRRGKAPEDRVRLLDAQAESTRAERARRRREIQEEYRPRHEVRPFRLHLVHVPAFLLPVDVRRGAQAFAFELTWVPAAAEFALVRCPACAAAQPLVATRGHLGCAACTSAARPPVPTPVADAVEPRQESTSRSSIDAGEPAPTSSSRAAAVPPARASQPPERPRRDRAHGRAQAAPRARARAVAGGSRARASRGDHERVGNKLALAFWQSVATGDRWPRAKAARHSPLRAVYRLYGNAGPQCAIGVPVGHHLDEVVASTYQTEPGAPELTVGSLTARGTSYRFAMSWSMQEGRPVVGEVMPAPHPLVLPAIRGTDAELGLRLRDRAPEPTVELDPVASMLWRTELGHSGLPLTVRCLAAWWRVQGSHDLSAPPTATAAAVASAVARAAGMRRTQAETAATYGVAVHVLRSVGTDLSAELRLGWGHAW